MTDEQAITRKSDQRGGRRFLKRFALLFLLTASLTGQQWLLSIEDSTRQTNGVERSGSTLSVYCSDVQRTFEFADWPPFGASSEYILSTRRNVNGKLFSVSVGSNASGDILVQASVDGGAVCVDEVVP